MSSFSGAWMVKNSICSGSPASSVPRERHILKVLASGVRSVLVNEVGPALRVSGTAGLLGWALPLPPDSVQPLWSSPGSVLPWNWAHVLPGRVFQHSQWATAMLWEGQGTNAMGPWSAFVHSDRSSCVWTSRWMSAPIGEKRDKMCSGQAAVWQASRTVVYTWKV